MSPTPARVYLPTEDAVELLGYEAGQVGVGEADDEELVGIGDGGRVFGDRQEVVVVRNPKGVQRGGSLLDIGAEGDAFDLGWNVVGGDAVGG